MSEYLPWGAAPPPVETICAVLGGLSIIVYWIVWQAMKGKV